MQASRLQSRRIVQLQQAGRLHHRGFARASSLIPITLTAAQTVQYLVHHDCNDPHRSTEARETLSATIRRVCRDHVPVIITRKREDSVVMMAQEDYDSLTESAYLLRSPKNARRLLDSIRELESGKGQERQLIE